MESHIGKLLNDTLLRRRVHITRQDRGSTRVKFQSLLNEITLIRMCVTGASDHKKCLEMRVHNSDIATIDRCGGLD
jgi:hypothetical protein